MMPSIEKDKATIPDSRENAGTPPGLPDTASAISRLGRRLPGPAVSLLLHGGLILAGLLSTAAPRIGRGGGSLASGEGDGGRREYSASFSQDITVDAGPRFPDVKVFPAPIEEPVEAPEAVPPPNQEFLQDVSETGTAVAKVPPAAEPPSPARSKQAYAKFPPPGGGGDDLPKAEPSTGGSGDSNAGTSHVSGTGGDTGGAGDGTAGALYMPAPIYPPSARRRGIEGTVAIEVDVYPDGHCESARVTATSGHDVLDQAALSAIGKWKYEPRAELTPVPRRVRFVFKLQK